MNEDWTLRIEIQNASEEEVQWLAEHIDQEIVMRGLLGYVIGEEK